MKLHHLLPIALLITSCQEASFQGTATRNPGVCESGEEYVGANFIFAIDNSGSMRETDCPSGNPDDCGITERENALLKTFDVLTEATKDSEFKDKTVSSFSVAKFTPADRKLTLAETETFSTTFETLPENRDLLAETLTFARRPKGATPYSYALQLGQTFLDDPALANHDQNILVLVTDGEPTDQSPSQVRELASQIDARIVTIRINHQKLTADERQQRHREIIAENYGSWATDAYPDVQAYADDLLALPADISTEPVIEIASVDDLETKLFEDIVKKTVPCLPQNES
jgi:hypothetical protein